MVREYKCDRCKSTFVGEECCGVTCGFYYVDSGPWVKFGKNNEKIVCDACIHSDPRYIAEYENRK